MGRTSYYEEAENFRLMHRTRREKSGRDEIWILKLDSDVGFWRAGSLFMYRCELGVMM